MSDSLTVSIISFNTLGVPVISRDLTERYVMLAKQIKKTDANILAFQEVHTYIHLQILKRLLPEFPYVVYKKYLYGPQGGLVIFSKLPTNGFLFKNFTQRGHLWSRTFYTRLIRTGILLCQLQDLPIYILNTYLTTNPNQNWDVKPEFATLQKSQLLDIVKTTEHIKSEKSACLIAGDFNFTKESNFYSEFLEQTKAEDIFAKVSLPTYLFERKPLKLSWNIPILDKLFVFNAKRSGQVDFIFLISNLNQVEIKDKQFLFDEEVKLFSGKESYLSDHIGLYTKLEFKL